MPGIIGIASENYTSAEDRVADLQRMESVISSGDACVRDDLFSDSWVSGVRIHNNILQQQPQPAHHSGKYIWFDGEFYNQNELLSTLGSENLTDPEILLGLFEKNGDFSYLKKIDGLFSAVIYDANQQKVHLISDRYGLRYLYWMRRNGSLIWSSEVKGFITLKGYEPTINRVALNQFISIGYVLENLTWFEEVEMLPSGTVLSFDIKTGKHECKRYWWWDEIRPLSGVINEDDVAEELGVLFKAAVERRCRENEDVGVTLSGGLDSRAILAAMPNRGAPVKALTFGKQGCDDVRFAKRVAAVKGAEHHVMDIGVENWLLPRISKVWLNDGLQDIQHAGGAGDLIAELYSINLGGIALDVTLGGGFLSGGKCFDSITAYKKALIAEKMGCNEVLLDTFEDYIGLGKTNYFFLQNRVRRFTYSGSVAARASFEERAPAFDNRLLEFTYSIPDSYRYQSRIYKKMLLHCFPEYFKKIPWQRTGMPISYSPFREKIHKKSQALLDGLVRRLNNIGISTASNKDFASYEQWIRKEPAKSFFEKMLCSPNALCREFIPSSEVVSVFNRHMSGENMSDQLCRYLTFELWLQQVYEEKYRNGME